MTTKRDTTVFEDIFGQDTGDALQAKLEADRRGYTWSNVVGNDLSAVELVELARASGQPLADWLKTQALDLWGAADCEDLDFDRLAAELAHDGAMTGTLTGP